MCFVLSSFYVALVQNMDRKILKQKPWESGKNKA